MAVGETISTGGGSGGPAGAAPEKHSRRPLRIAFIGQKGIPAHGSFGGVEFHVEGLARNLARRGHSVTAYVRDWYTPREVVETGGVRLVHTPTILTKHLDATIHSFTSSLHALRERYDVIHYHSIGPSCSAWIPRLAGSRVVVTVHLLDWQSPKWGPFARMCLKWSERSSVYFADQTLSVSKGLKRYLEEKYARPVLHVPNAVAVEELTPPDLIATRFGLAPNGYILFLGRIVGHKRVDWLVRAFLRAGAAAGRKLVIAGDGDKESINAVREIANGDPRLVFTGAVDGQLKEELLSNALLFVLPSVLEGQPIALMEAMAHARPCLVSDIEANREVVEDDRTGLLFRTDDIEHLKTRLAETLAGDPGRLHQLGEDARRKMKTDYSWEATVDLVENVYRAVLNGKGSA